MQPVIGIAAKVVALDHLPWTPSLFGLDHTYSDAVARAGGTPIILPVTEEKKLQRRLYDLCDGILLAGGDDVDPHIFGGEPTEKTQPYNRPRDDQEIQLIKWAVKDDKPLLGICRGMQIMNVAFGGTLYQDIADEAPKASATHMAAFDKKNFAYIAHKLRLKPNSIIAKILGDNEIAANAYHHQAIDRLGKSLVATGWAEDDIIEAIEMPNQRFAIGIQSHPEVLEAKEVTHWRKLFTAFVDASKA
jgi:putative glutamine amidotransferase